jgi:hypothetical protein
LARPWFWVLFSEPELAGRWRIVLAAND